ncbi:MAG: hypothetical protein ACI85K_002774 [Hyphomicrobiaceae bacterium]|jgi:hypothetical protein
MRCDLVVLGLVLVGSLAAQGVALPDGTGYVQPSMEWTVLQGADLARAERASDPATPRARGLVTDIVADLLAREITEHHVVLHRAGAGEDTVQIINCYSAESCPPSSELLSKTSVDETCAAVIEALAKKDVTLICTGFETSLAWKVPSLLLHFEQERPDGTIRTDLQIVPTGTRLQYFESQFMASDNTAARNIQDVLTTFDGAKEPEGRVSNLLIGGLAGAAAGVLTALFRRKRQQQRMSAAGV